MKTDQLLTDWIKLYPTIRPTLEARGCSSKDYHKLCSPTWDALEPRLIASLDASPGSKLWNCRSGVAFDSIAAFVWCWGLMRVDCVHRLFDADLVPVKMLDGWFLWDLTSILTAI